MLDAESSEPLLGERKGVAVAPSLNGVLACLDRFKGLIGAAAHDPDMHGYRQNNEENSHEKIFNYSPRDRGAPCGQKASGSRLNPNAGEREPALDLQMAKWRPGNTDPNPFHLNPSAKIASEAARRDPRRKMHPELMANHGDWPPVRGGGGRGGRGAGVSCLDGVRAFMA